MQAPVHENWVERRRGRGDRPFQEPSEDILTRAVGGGDIGKRLGVYAQAEQAFHIYRAGIAEVAAEGTGTGRARLVLAQLVAAGVVMPLDGGRAHTVQAAHWTLPLGLPDTPSLPLHHGWIPVMQGLGRVADHLLTPEPADRSPYLDASAIGELLETVGPDLLAAGVRLPSRREVIAAPDPWVLLGGAMAHAMGVVSGRADRRPTAPACGRAADP